ncbi:uncharacterized protein LOC129237565 [Anastrepha obliqua]|uniref:uncharacterized protein LOC129237565 n=1 Tax=Anastrepha obliqua TaxID=95512 RepID=UPI00240987D5|nr:uncharacterized protein LOC129237565 [Anastrepha obliqua]
MALKLSRDDTINLIRIYGEYECLWNCRKKTYKDLFLKKVAWEDIANHFGTDVYEIKKKLKYLRTVYVAERRKLEESKKNSVNPLEVYQPTLFYYNEFSYLDNTIVLRKRQLSDEEETLPKQEPYDELSNDTNEQLYENESTWEMCTPDHYMEEEFQQPNIKRIKSTPHVNTNTPIATNCSVHSSKYSEKDQSSNASLSTDDMYLAFGKSVGLQLRNLKTINAVKAMAQIQETLTSFAVSEE